MHVQIVSFRLKGLGEQDYAKLCDDLAPTFAGLPGLATKVWLANRDTGTFGGVYLWEDRQAMERYTKTDLFAAVATHPNLSDVVSHDFAVLEAPTRVTRGLVEARV
jgi:Putative mono-oxygenase ydhR